MFLGKQGLAFRGYRHEAAHALTDDDVNHGNFLELVKLVAESDNCLKEHIDRVVEPSKKTLLKCQDGKVDGNYVPGNRFQSRHHNQNYSNLAEEGKSAGMFSVEMDTTDMDTR